MAEVSDRVVLHRQVALVHRRDERETIHVLEDGPFGVAHHAPVRTVGEPGDMVEGPSLRHFLDGEIEFAARREVDGAAHPESRFGPHGDRGAHHADKEPRILGLQGLRHLEVARERGRARVHDAEVVVSRARANVIKGEPIGGRIDEPGARNERGGLSQPRRIPEGADLAPGLIARAGAPVEAIGGRWVQEQGAEVVGGHRAQDSRRPPTEKAG